MVGDIFQPTHLLFVLVVALLVLGPKRLPEVGRTLGSGIRDFRQALSGETPDPPRREESEQVAATELRHQPEVAAENDISWPEEAVGPMSFDEPVEAASAEPATAVVTDAEPAEAATDDDVDTGGASGSPLTDEAPASNLSFYEHALSRRASENGGDSPESHSDQSS
ncbi:MAG TPA: twin-arginine translocase TatA/TatE family subunit [Solirubrobacteraceae bacterium]|nr:twin-arginine translocase TatA/TatE family subunit [Solirubrobacteraceae bacterium]